MKNNYLFNKSFSILLILAVLVLSSCGGGGGGGSGNISVFGSSGFGYTDLFNNHSWENVNGVNKTTLICDNSRLTVKTFVNGVEQPGTTTSPYELKNAEEMGKKGKIKCNCINNGAETEFTFDKLVSPDSVTLTINGLSTTFTRK